MEKDTKEVELIFNRYDENDFCYETVHFTVERKWLEYELAPQTIEEFMNDFDYNSDEASDMYTYALLYDRVLEEWTECHDSMKDIVDDQKEQKAVDRFYGVDDL